MTKILEIKRLNEILEQRNTQKILKSLIQEGFTDMTKDKEMKNFSLVDIAKSEEYQRSEYFKNLNYGFSASLHGKIKGLSDCQVVWIQVDDIDYKFNKTTPKNCFIFYSRLI